MMGKWIIIIFVGLALALNRVEANLSQNKEIVLYGNNTAGPYRLNDQFILVGSDSIFLADSLVCQDRYQINYEEGIVFFTFPIAESTKVVIRYQNLPLRLKTSYFKYSIETERGVSDKKDVRKEQLDTDSSTHFEDLIVTGSKTLGFSVSSGQGLGIEQSTQLSLVGMVSQVEVEAVLSDQSSPIPAEGVTKEIAELDKILIKIRKDKNLLSFGDYDLTLPFGQFGSIKRRAIGANLVANLNNLNVQTFYLRPKGKFRKIVFSGKDGVQGPYRLTGDDPFSTIVPASEIVYLNGEKMTRGWNEDYTIDYALAEITFTNKRIITNHSRIEVNFESTFDAYDRSSFGIGQVYDLKPFNFSVKAFLETDNPNRSFAYSFTSPELESLGLIGDDTSQAWLSGAKYVGANKGDYRKVADHYVYAGRGLGDFLLTFTWVGDSLGDYSYEDTIYVYKGSGKGGYVAKRKIMLPEKNELYSTEVGLKTSSGFTFDWQGLLNQTDHNLFSRYDDDDNKAFGYLVNTSFKRANYGLGYERKYTPFDYSNSLKSQEVDFSYRWGDIQEPKRLVTDEVTGFLKPFRFLEANFLAGRLLTRKREEQKRFNFGAQLFWAGYQINKIYLSSREILRQNLNLTPQLLFFSPQLNVFKEDRTFVRHFIINPAIGLKSLKKLQAVFSYEQAQKDTLITDWQKERIRRLYKIDLKTKPFKALELNTIFGSQISESYLLSANRGWRQYFTDLQTNYFLTEGITFRLSHHRSNQAKEVKKEVYVRVDSGTGDYKLNPETGTFYPDKNGDYRRIFELTGITLSTHSQEWQGEMDLTVFTPFNINWLVNFQDEATDTKVLAKIYTHNARIGFFPLAQRIAIYLANNYDYTLDYRYLNQTEWQNRNGLEVQIGSTKDLSLRTEFDFNLMQKSRSALNLIHHELEHKITFEPFIGYKLDMVLTLSQSWRKARYSNYGEFRLQVLAGKLKKNFKFSKNTILSTEIAMTRRTANIPKLPFEIGLNDPLGVTPSFGLNLDRILGKELVLSVSYYFSARPDRVSEQSLSANLRAYF